MTNFGNCKIFTKKLQHFVFSQIINKMIEKMRVDSGVPDEDDLVYSSIDVLRYVMSMLNLWEIAPEDVSLAFSLKDTYLELDHKINTKKWSGQPVAIVDIDDVLAEFRTPFAEFLSRVYDIEADVRKKCVFTTHTPVPAGHDVFSSDLMDSFFAHYWHQLHLSREQFLAL